VPGGAVDQLVGREMEHISVRNKEPSALHGLHPGVEFFKLLLFVAKQSRHYSYGYISIRPGTAARRAFQGAFSVPHVRNSTDVSVGGTGLATVYGIGIWVHSTYLNPRYTKHPRQPSQCSKLC
jgi:hypothetical protein